MKQVTLPSIPEVIKLRTKPLRYYSGSHFSGGTTPFIVVETAKGFAFGTGTTKG